MRAFLAYSALLFAMSIPLSHAGPFSYLKPRSAPAQSEKAQTQTLLGAFDRAREFSNYILPEEYRGMPPEKVPLSVVQARKEKLEQAIASIFSRAVLPVAETDEHGVTRITYARYFPLLQKKLRQIDPTLKLYPAAGVVRAAVSRIYNELYEGASKNPPESSDAVLKRIIEATEDVPGIEIRGVGSDLDIFFTGNPEKADLIKSKAMEITHGIENSSRGLTEMEETGLKRNLITRGDFKELHKQIREASEQGGTALDWLAFDIDMGRLVDPPRHPHVSEEMIRGFYTYLPPKRESRVSDTTVVRGARTAMELPFLEIHGEDLLKQDLRNVTAKVLANKPFQMQIVSQFDKMVRNSRWSGAHNRFLRGEAGSIEATLLELARVLEERERRPLIPEFLPYRPLESQPRPKLPAQALIPLDQFLSKYTLNGKLLHATPNAENGLAILRGGLFVKRDETYGDRGPGAYTTPAMDTAKVHARGNGLIFELEVVHDPRLRIVDFQKLGELMPEFRDLPKDRRDAAIEKLAKQYGADIIVNEQVLIQNSAAIKPPDQSTLIRSIGHQLENSELDVITRSKLLSAYTTLYQVGTISPSETLPHPDEYARKFVRHLIETMRSDPQKRQEAVNLYADCLGQFREALMPTLSEALEIGNDHLDDGLQLYFQLERLIASGDLERTDLTPDQLRSLLKLLQKDLDRRLTEHKDPHFAVRNIEKWSKLYPQEFLHAFEKMAHQEINLQHQDLLASYGSIYASLPKEAQAEFTAPSKFSCMLLADTMSRANPVQRSFLLNKVQAIGHSLFPGAPEETYARLLDAYIAATNPPFLSANRAATVQGRKEFNETVRLLAEKSPQGAQDFLQALARKLVDVAAGNDANASAGALDLLDSLLTCAQRFQSL